MALPQLSGSRKRGAGRPSRQEMGESANSRAGGTVARGSESTDTEGGTGRDEEVPAGSGESPDQGHVGHNDSGVIPLESVDAQVLYNDIGEDGDLDVFKVEGRKSARKQPKKGRKNKNTKYTVKSLAEHVEANTEALHSILDTIADMRRDWITAAPVSRPRSAQHRREARHRQQSESGTRKRRVQTTPPDAHTERRRRASRSGMTGPEQGAAAPLFQQKSRGRRQLQQRAQVVSSETDEAESDSNSEQEPDDIQAPDSLMQNPGRRRAIQRHLADTTQAAKQGAKAFPVYMCLQRFLHLQIVNLQR